MCVNHAIKSLNQNGNVLLVVQAEQGGGTSGPVLGQPTLAACGRSQTAIRCGC